MITGEAEALDWLRTLPQWQSDVEDRARQLLKLLAEENARQNLVSSASLASAWQRHVADSAQLLLHSPPSPKHWLDLGTGAGFPGLIIALLLSETQVTLVEARRRRCEWLVFAADALSLSNVTVVCSRLERMPAETVNVISARAFAPLSTIVDLAARFSTADTTWLLPKGRSATQELEALSGWRHTFHVEHSVTDPDAGVLVGTLISNARQKP